MALKDFWKVFVLSFYSPELYITVAKKWHNWGLSFLLSLSIFAASISSVVLFVYLYSFNFSSPKITNLLNQIPELQIENNAAHLSDPSIKLPFKIKKSPNNIQDFIIIDLSINDASQYKQNVIVFTKDRIAFNFIDSTAFDITYQDLLEGSNLKIINAESLTRFLDISRQKLLGTILVLGIPLGSLICFLINLFKSGFYALVANLIVKILQNNQLNFKSLTRLAIIANAPAITFSFIVSTLFFEESFNQTIQSIINSTYMFYFIFAILVCNRNRVNQ